MTCNTLQITTTFLLQQLHSAENTLRFAAVIWYLHKVERTEPETNKRRTRATGHKHDIPTLCRALPYQIGVRGLAGVKIQLDSLSVSSTAGADLLIAGGWPFAAGVANSRLDY